MEKRGLKALPEEIPYPDASHPIYSRPTVLWLGGNVKPSTPPSGGESAPESLPDAPQEPAKQD